MIKKTHFKDLIIFENISFKDSRGYFKELLKERDLKKKFLFSVMSFSKKNVIRGLHLQTKESQGKFISVLKGKIFDVAVDLRKNSKTFGKHFKSILSEKNNKSIYIPPGFAHGFCTLSKENYIAYIKRGEIKEIDLQMISKDLLIQERNLSRHLNAVLQQLILVSGPETRKKIAEMIRVRNGHHRTNRSWLPAKE